MRGRLLIYFIFISIGVAIGGFLFSDSQPRNFLQFKECRKNCFSAKELAGLLTSVGIQKFPQILPKVIAETDKTIAIPHPAPETPIHYLVIPKKDIKNIGEISDEDKEFIMDAFAVIRKIAVDEKIDDYQVITNGPGQQKVTYLHFHFMAFPEQAGNKAESR